MSILIECIKNGRVKIKPCPFCGADANFVIAHSFGIAIQCSGKSCKIHTPSIDLPSYWSKGGKRLAARMRQRALNIWNNRNRRIDAKIP